MTILPSEISAIRDDGWEEIELMVDSGASETVMSEDMLQSVETKEGRGSKNGVVYEVANGVRIANLGEKKFLGTSGEGISRQITAQVCDVNKGLLSVSKMMRSGHRVVFDQNGSYIEDPTSGEIMNLQERNGVFVLRLWTKASDMVFRGRAEILLQER